jgi:hypothetical protein
VIVYPLDFIGGDGDGALSVDFVGRCFRENSVADIPRTDFGVVGDCVYPRAALRGLVAQLSS